MELVHTMPAPWNLRRMVASLFQRVITQARAEIPRDTPLSTTALTAYLLVPKNPRPILLVIMERLFVYARLQMEHLKFQVVTFSPKMDPKDYQKFI